MARLYFSILALVVAGAEAWTPFSQLSGKEWEAVMDIVTAPYKQKMQAFWDQVPSTPSVYSNIKRVGEVVFKPEHYRKAKKDKRRRLSSEQFVSVDSDDFSPGRPALDLRRIESLMRDPETNDVNHALDSETSRQLLKRYHK
jgi:hypothetical protein